MLTFTFLAIFSATTSPECRQFFLVGCRRLEVEHCLPTQGCKDTSMMVMSGDDAGSMMVTSGDDVGEETGVLGDVVGTGDGVNTKRFLFFLTATDMAYD